MDLVKKVSYNIILYWVIQQMGIQQQEIMTRIGRAHLSYFGHIERRKGECLEKIILEGAVEGVRKRGRPAKRWMDNIKKMSECSGARSKE